MACLSTVPTINGSNQYFSAADSASTSYTGNNTMELWLNPLTAPTAGQLKRVLTKDDENTQRSFALYYSNAFFGAGLELSAFYFASASAYTSVNWQINLGTNNWKHVAVRCTIANAASSKAELVINGVSQGNGTGTDVGGGCTAMANSTARVVIAEWDGGTGADGLNAKYSLVRLWNTNKSVANINTDKCSILGATSNLQAEWTLDNSTADNSGNGNTLTNNGSITFNAGTPPCLSCSVGSPFLLNLM